MTDKDILHLIPYGKDNAITKAELMQKTGKGDRSVRKVIERLRESGEVILSSSHSVGYWRSDEDEDIKAYLAENNHRIMKLHRTNRRIKQKHYERTGQKYTTVREHERKIS